MLYKPITSLITIIHPFKHLFQYNNLSFNYFSNYIIIKIINNSHIPTKTILPTLNISPYNKLHNLPQYTLINDFFTTISLH